MLATLRALLIAVALTFAYAFVQPRFRSAATVSTYTTQISLPSIVAATLVAKNTKDCKCSLCNGTGALNCVPCKGTGIDKVNGNVFER